MNRGFTLIETIIYLALFSLLLLAAVVSAYSLEQVVGAENDGATIANEASFIEGKLRSAVHEGSSLEVKDAGSTLVIHTRDSVFNPIQMQFDADTSSLLMSEGSAELIPITTSNVKTTGGRFSVLADAEGVGRGVDMRFELSGHAYDIHEYLLP